MYGSYEGENSNFHFYFAICCVITSAKTQLSDPQTRLFDLSLGKFSLWYTHIFGFNAEMPFGYFC